MNFTVCRRLLFVLACLLAGCTSSVELPLTAAHDAQVPSITLRGYRFHAQTFGDPGKQPLIVVHGGPGADFRYLLGLQALADDYYVVFYDQRGTGLSPRLPAQDISVDAYVDDLDAFVTHVGRGRPVHLLGHSWGAMLASAYTGRHPEKVQRLILAEPGFLDTTTLQNLNPGGWPGWTVIAGMARAWFAQWQVATGGDIYARRDYLIGRILPLFQADGTCDGRVPAVPSWRAGSPAFDATIGRMQEDATFAAQLSFRNGVEAFTGETLFLVGQCSRTIGEAQQMRHIVHFQHARLVSIANAGHFMFNDQPAASMQAVRRFLTTEQYTR